ncbi:dna ligase 4 [Fusarium heterosporum]|uniref:Dna ligase 4 n=1 Tax=Fusarium heterosporum TaxID=42747 RepID=A0A8H5TZD9_FUSHE|nr:dna ligase 4 [Fusarium heterosporum]
MHLPFFLVCELLEKCYDLSLAKKDSSSVVIKWFTRHRNYVDAYDTSLCALLSTLLPDKRTDRVYCIQAPSLERIVGRAFFLGSSRIAELAHYRQPGSGVDLADCVARILFVTPSPGYSQKDPVTVEEIDELLHSLAAKVKWSSPSIRTSQASMTPGNRTDVEWLYRRLSAIEAKWFTRLILKNYQPLVLDAHLVYRLCDTILPYVLKIQDDFSTAINSVQAIRGRLLPNTGRKTPREQIMGTVKPQLGVKIGRQPWIKGRSIKHCLDMGTGRMSVEDKIDGEYCQIHIDPSKGDRCIQMFSKSGKDSTEDRVALHDTILGSLRIGQPNAKVKKACILEGELVVYDDSSLINLRQSERFKILSNLICCRKGWAELVPRQVVDFGQVFGASTLRKIFAATILARKEGLVLKPDEPYFDFTDQRRRFSSCCIKLKKEYIGNFGDVGDFAVVGAGYDPTKALAYRIPGLKWTHFYVGCLENREAVKRWNAKPEFTIVNIVELNEMMLKEVVMYSNTDSAAPDENNALTFKLAQGVEQGSYPAVIFNKPLVFDLKCFSFDRVGNTGFWSLRFPSVTKVHFDRDFTDTITFDELQALAKDATTATELEDSQENLQWIAKLEAADPRGIAVDAVSQLTATTISTPSPQKSTQNTTSTRSPISPLRARLSAANQIISCRETAGSTYPLVLSTATASTVFSPARTASILAPQAKHKRDAPSIHPESSHKRQKSNTDTVQNPQRLSDRESSLQSRKPFDKIDNNSQSAMATHVTEEIYAQDATHEDELALSMNIQMGRDTDAHWELEIEAGAVLTKPRTGHVDADLDHDGSNDGDDGDHRPEDGDTGVCCELETETQPVGYKPRRVYVDVDLEDGDDGDDRSGGCVFAGVKCLLAKAVILVTSGVLHKHEAKTLLELHGIHDPVTNAAAWLEAEQAGSHKETTRNISKVYLLCDSDRHDELKPLLAKIKDIHHSPHSEKHSSIEVYDWHFLRHLTIEEDKSIKDKYYDGFRHSRERWYIGSV